MRGILYANFVKAATWVGGDVPQWNHCVVRKVGRALYECAFWDLHKIMQYSGLHLVLLWTFLKIFMLWCNAILPFTLMLFFAAGDPLETSWWTLSGPGTWWWEALSQICAFCIFPSWKWPCASRVARQQQSGCLQCPVATFKKHTSTGVKLFFFKILLSFSFFSFLQPSL